MAKLNVPPTKSALLRVKRDLAFAKEGHALLEEKRQILVIELMNQVARARTIQGEVDEALRKAHAALRRAALTVGSEALRREALAVHADHQVRVTHRPVMGIGLPTVRLEVAPLVAQFAPGLGSVTSDAAMLAFREVLARIGDLAEAETVVYRVALELRKTQRRVNALEKVFIPAYQETMTYITSTLEERERDEFVVMKRLKARGQAQREEG
jgi:V/A-type H+-transporting ATPase subunit D